MYLDKVSGQVKNYTLGILQQKWGIVNICNALNDEI
jgi:hypothetical protein